MPTPKMNYHVLTVCAACQEMVPCVGVPCRNENMQATVRLCASCMRHALLQIDVVHRKPML